MNMTMFKYRLIYAFVSLFPLVCYAGEKVDFLQDTLTGDWNGVRSKLDVQGVDIMLNDTFDGFANLNGGIKRGGAVLNQEAATVTLDGDKLIGVHDLSAMVSAIDNAGSPSRSLVGAAERIDNIETYYPGFELYQAWVQKNWYGGGISLLGGVYDLSNEFYDLDSSDFFINTGFAMGGELADTAQNGVAIFPTSALSIRLRVQPSEEWYIQTVLSDGINGAPLTNRHPPFANLNSPAILVIEGGYLPQENKKQLGKFAIGAWSYTGGLHNILRPGTEQTSINNRGIYALAEYSLIKKDGDPNKGLKGFLRAGYADSDFARFNASWSTGLLYTGVFPGRDKSQLGFAISQVHTSGDYRSEDFTNPNIEPQILETALELSYKDLITPWLSFQPDIQYIMEPGALGLREQAFVIGVRTVINF